MPRSAEKMVDLSSIVWDPKVYPRAKWNTSTINEYAEKHAAGEEFPPLVLEKGTNKLLDGKHRLEMYKKRDVKKVRVVYEVVPNGVPIKLFAASFSVRHGDRLTNSDMKDLVREIYRDNAEFSQEIVGKRLGIRQQRVSEFVSDIVAKVREERKGKVLRLSMLGWTQRAIAERLGVEHQQISRDLAHNTEFGKMCQSGHSPEEIGRRLGWPIQLVLAKKMEKATDAERLEELGIKIQPYDVWQFAGCHDLMGDVHPGRIPGQIVCHILYFYTKPGDLVIDPMVGSGTTLDACLLMGRKCRGYDIDERHDRIDIEKHNLRIGWPDTIKETSLIFWDPPYFDKMDGANTKGGYKKGSISGLSRDEYLEFLGESSSAAYKEARHGTRMAFLMADWNDNQNQIDGIFVWDYAQLLMSAGWTINRHIQVPLSTQGVHPDIVNKYRESRKLARLSRYILICEKVSKLGIGRKRKKKKRSK